MVRNLLFRLVRPAIARLLGTPLGRSLWHVPGSRRLYRKMIGTLRPSEVSVDGHVLELDPLDSLLLSVNGTYEETERERFRAAIRPGDTVIDVGAHIGLYTLDAARAVGPTGRVLAFEPSDENRRLLKANVQRNGYENVEIFEAAVSDYVGQAVLRLSHDNTGDNQVVADAATGATTQTVSTVTLDSLPIETAEVVKMDIQGGEPAALRGAAALIARSPRLVIFTELSPTHLGDAGAFAFREQLETAGFTLHELGSPGSDHVDLMCVKNSEPGSLAR